MKQQGQFQIISFKKGVQKILVTKQLDKLIIRREIEKENFTVFIVIIQSQTFPDQFRYSSLNTVDKLFQHLQTHRDKCIQFQDGMLQVLIQNQMQIRVKMIEFRPAQQENNNFKNTYLWDLNTPYAHHYKINKNKIEKNKSGWFQLVGMLPLSKQKKQTFRFKVQKYGGVWSIGFGILIQSRKMEQYSGDIDHPQSACLWSRNNKKSSCVCLNGEKVHDWDQKLFIKESKTVIMEYDPLKNSLLWLVNQSEMKIDLGQQFLCKNIYLLIVIHDANSIVQQLK